LYPYVLFFHFQQACHSPYSHHTLHNVRPGLYLNKSTQHKRPESEHWERKKNQSIAEVAGACTYGAKIVLSIQKVNNIFHILIIRLFADKTDEFTGRYKVNGGHMPVTSLAQTEEKS
jgi:hypothetical protein